LIPGTFKYQVHSKPDQQQVGGVQLLFACHRLHRGWASSIASALSVVVLAFPTKTSVSDHYRQSGVRIYLITLPQVLAATHQCALTPPRRLWIDHECDITDSDFTNNQIWNLCFFTNFNWRDKPCTERKFCFSNSLALNGRLAALKWK